MTVPETGHSGGIRGLKRPREIVAFLFTTVPGIVLTSLLIALAGAGLVHPVLVTRQIELSLEVRSVGPAWEIEWVPCDGGRSVNGFWVDLAAHGVPRVDGRFTTVAPLLVRRELPSYPVREIALKWNECEGGAYAIRRLCVVTKFAGRPVRTVVLVDAPAAGPIATEPATSEVRFAAPGVAGVLWLYVAALAWAVVLMGYLGLKVAVKLPPLWDRLFAGAAFTPSARAVRWVKMGAWAAAVGAPLWLAAWAPMILMSDSTAYIWLGKLLWENRDINHLDGWRLPGYALFIAPWVAYTEQYTLWIGLAHAVLGIASAVLAFDILRRRGLGGVWPYVGMLMVALDPMMLVWQRTVLSECLGGFLILLVAWAFVVIEPRLRAGRAVVAVILFAALGVLCGVSAIVRGNLQLLPLVIGAGVVAIGVIHGRAWRGVLAAGAMIAVFALVVSPIVRYNARVFGRASMVVGTNSGRTIFAWQNTDIDFNQTRLFTLEEFRDLSGRVARGEVNEWAFTAEMERNTRVAVPAGTHPWVARDLRCTELLRESMSRMPARYAKRLVKATASQLGFWVEYPYYFKRTSAGQVSVLRGKPVAEPTNFYDAIDRFPATIRPTFERVIHDSSDVHKSVNAKVLGVWWNIWREARPVLVLLLAFGALRALVRRDVPTLVLAGFVFGNAAAVAVMQFSGEDRYGMPFFGVGDVAMLVGLLGGIPGRMAQRTPVE